jgi:hypothetical protein
MSNYSIVKNFRLADHENCHPLIQGHLVGYKLLQKDRSPVTCLVLRQFKDIRTLRPHAPNFSAPSWNSKGLYIYRLLKLFEVFAVGEKRALRKTGRN